MIDETVKHNRHKARANSPKGPVGAGAKEDSSGAIRLFHWPEVYAPTVASGNIGGCFVSARAGTLVW